MPCWEKTQPKLHPHWLPRPPGWTAVLKRWCRTALQGAAFFFPLITQLCLIGKSNHLRNVPLAWAILMNFHRFPCIAVASLVLVPEVHTVQAAVKARMNKGNSTNINLVGKCCSALHKFSIRVLIRDITTPKPSTPCRWQQDRQIISTGRDRHLRSLWHLEFL